jgi:hypothetical protein
MVMIECIVKLHVLPTFLSSDVVEMASCAPLFVNDNDRR